MKWISAATLVRAQTAPAYPLTRDPMAGVSIDDDNEGLDSELFSEFVGAFSAPSSGDSLASSAVASASVFLFDSNNSAAARLAKTLADTLVAGPGLSLEVNMVRFWLLL